VVSCCRLFPWFSPSFWRSLEVGKRREPCKKNFLPLLNFASLLSLRKQGLLHKDKNLRDSPMTSHATTILPAAPCFLSSSLFMSFSLQQHQRQHHVSPAAQHHVNAAFLTNMANCLHNNATSTCFA
jgi:hypothetical protein